MRPKEVSDRLQLDKIAKDHVWKVEPSCATTGEGIFEGLVCLDSFTLLAPWSTNTPTQAWLSNNVKLPPGAK
jgi:ADP-ribosylation factor protein 6